MTVLIVSHECERKSTTPHETTFGAFFLGILLLQNGSWIRSSRQQSVYLVIGNIDQRDLLNVLIFFV